MSDEAPEREQRVTPLELFFDLVVVFAITEVTQLMASDLTWRGLGRGMLVLSAIWWSWTGYAWLTNNLEPEAGPVRAGMFAAMAAMFVVALAVPRAFANEGVVFGVAYLLVRLINMALYAVARKATTAAVGDALLRLVPSTIAGPALILLAGALGGTWRTPAWIAALVVIYVGGYFGVGDGWRTSPAHYAERYGAIVIIALGESVISLGVGAVHESLSAGLVTASVLGILVISALWWAYFDVTSVLAQRALERASDARRARLARDVYAYIHLPMIAGIVLFALGLERTITHLDGSLSAVPAVALLGGLSLYYAAHVVHRIRLVAFIRHTQDESPSWIGPGRLVAATAALVLIPAALALPALASLALAMAVCWGLIAWDLIHYREERVVVRRARP